MKLPKQTDASYTVRAAVEMFVAARAPAGFYGNSFSTFSRGVALLRSGSTCTGEHEAAVDDEVFVPRKIAVQSCRSFAYDCNGKFETQEDTRLHIVDAKSCESESSLRVVGAVGSLETRGARTLSNGVAGGARLPVPPARAAQQGGMHPAERYRPNRLR